MPVFGGTVLKVQQAIVWPFLVWLVCSFLHLLKTFPCQQLPFITKNRVTCCSTFPTRSADTFFYMYILSNRSIWLYWSTSVSIFICWQWKVRHKKWKTWVSVGPKQTIIHQLDRIQIIWCLFKSLYQLCVYYCLCVCVIYLTGKRLLWSYKPL